MTDKEFKRLNRSQLIDIIYQLQIKQEELIAENEKLSKALDDRRLRLGKVGSLAEAALEIHNVFQAAQEAADHYVEEVHLRIEKERQRILKKAEDEAKAIIEQARREAAGIPEKAVKTGTIDFDRVETTLPIDYKIGK